VTSNPGRRDTGLLVELINTYYLGDQSDVLRSDAAAWLREHLGWQRRVPAAPALTPLREVREGLRQLAIANNGGAAADPVLGRADAVLERVPLVVRLDGADAVVGTTAPEGSVQQMVAMVARAYLACRIDGAWRRVKACAEPNCRWAFLDLSRNGSRRWCDMSECGNRAKNRTWRSRHTNQHPEAT
jgi:predicted RNA-binding Zn ribbon-like protein